ncbi:ABC transporter permease [Mycoplasma sp. CSL10166]|uniref:ABC transporter permease n=1 Tax=Mycoplasma sp. CSL10166 TaxID=2813825 RepID=UPI00197C60A3|nr:ABC transporter permease [Mycoplasma sp. CSL10166]MBN4084182.1 ABC transporter permease [Mycoplasma sp. CSL10166]
MTNYILKRIGFAILTLLIILVVVFLLVAQFSENPFAQKAIGQADGAGSSGSVEKLIQLYEQSVKYHFLPSDWAGKYNLHANEWMTYKLNPIARFGYWINDLFTNSDHPFGLPFEETIFTRFSANSIPQIFFKYLRYSVIITIPAFVVSAIIGIALGIISGYKRGTIFDTAINAFSLLFIALPSFIIAPILISILLKFGVTPKFLLPTDTEHTSGEIFLSWLPPIAIITLGSLSVYITYTRNQIITVLTSNHVLIAKSKGLSKSEIFFKHVLRNISIPLAALLIPSYIGLLSGGIVIELYWAVPGTSQVLAQAFPTGEINIIMFNTLFFTALGIFTSILVDVSYTVLDPRIKYNSGSNQSNLVLLKRTLTRNKEFKKNLLEMKGVRNDS